MTRPIVLDAEFEGVIQDPWGNQRLGFTASAEIDRNEFGVSFNAALETGGFVVSPKVKLEIEAGGSPPGLSSLRTVPPVRLDRRDSAFSTTGHPVHVCHSGPVYSVVSDRFAN